MLQFACEGAAVVWWGAAVARCVGGAEVWWTTGRAVVWWGVGALAWVVVTGMCVGLLLGAEVVVVGAADVVAGAVDEDGDTDGDADGDTDGDMEGEGEVCVAVGEPAVVDAASPAPCTPAGPHAASVSAAMPVASARAVFLRFMPRTVGAARCSSRAERDQLRSVHLRP